VALALAPARWKADRSPTVALTVAAVALAALIAGVLARRLREL
jgi:hypothetical protein